MTQIFNQKQHKLLRQKLRKESPSAERVLWKKLCHRQIRDLKFHRQYSIENFIVDFYCPKIKLIIEVDGDIHYQPETSANDIIRNKKLQEFGLTILRFDNNDVYHNLNGVMERIYEVVNNSLNPSQPPLS